jgi:hypothetical protein
LMGLLASMMVLSRSGLGEAAGPSMRAAAVMRLTWCCH